MGRLVTEKLISKGFFVKIFDLPSANYEGFDPNKTEIIRGDLNDKSDLEFAINNVHSIIHLAAILPPLANENQELAKKVNVEGTKKLVEVVEKNNPKAHFIFSSSVSIYGKNLDNKKVTENTNPNPDDNYANTKFESEEMEIGFNSKYLLDIALQMHGEEMQFSLSDSSSPALITDPDQEGIIFVLMPMRV